MDNRRRRASGRYWENNRSGVPADKDIKLFEQPLHTPNKNRSIKVSATHHMLAH